MTKITRDMVEERIGTDPNIILVEVLAEEQFHEAHLPNAINVPLGDDFDKQIEIALPDKSMPVIVYCRGSDCEASSKAVKRMEEIGYSDVHHYSEGKEDWRSAGLPMIGYG